MDADRLYRLWGLDYARLKQYLMHTWEKQEQFEQDLDAYLCSCCTREGI